MGEKLKVQHVRLTPDEDEALQLRADDEGLSVAGLLRKGVGLPPLGRGGVREGAGRPTAKRPKKKA